MELPSFKGRPGWEFTELGDFSLEAWEPAPANGTAFEASHLLEPPSGSIELVQVDGASTDGAADEVLVLPLAVAPGHHPQPARAHRARGRVRGRGLGAVRLRLGRGDRAQHGGQAARRPERSPA